MKLFKNMTFCYGVDHEPLQQANGTEAESLSFCFTFPQQKVLVTTERFSNNSNCALQRRAHAQLASADRRDLRIVFGGGFGQR